MRTHTHTYVYTYPSAECVKSFDCDNKAYNFLALLTQLKRVIDRARAGQKEGSHHREVRGIFTYATSKGKREATKPQHTMQTIERRAPNRLTTKFAGCQLQASQKRETEIHAHTYVHIQYMVHGVYEAPYICHGIFICAALNMHYATQRR